MAIEQRQRAGPLYRGTDCRADRVVLIARLHDREEQGKNGGDSAIFPTDQDANLRPCIAPSGGDSATSSPSETRRKIYGTQTKSGTSGRVPANVLGSSFRSREFFQHSWSIQSYCATLTLDNESGSLTWENGVNQRIMAHGWPTKTFYSMQQHQPGCCGDDTTAPHFVCTSAFQLLLEKVEYLRSLKYNRAQNILRPGDVQQCLGGNEEFGRPCES